MSNIVVKIQALNNPIRSIFSFKGLGIILFVFFLLSEAFTLSGFVLAILTLLWILYVPLGVGNFFIKIPVKSIKSFSNCIDSPISNVLVKWFIGLFLILLVTFTTNSVGQLRIATIVGPALLLISAISFHLPKINLNKKIESRKVNRSIIKILVIGSVMGILFGVYIRSFSPYPLSPGFDIFAHMHVAKSVVNGPIDTNTDVYIPTFDLLIGLGSGTFKADIVNVFWTGAILLFSLFAISLYGMVYWITKNHACAFIGSFIGLAVTETGLVPNLPHFYPSSFVMCLFPIAFVLVDDIWKQITDKKIRVISTLIVFSGLILIHYQLGLVATFITSVYLIISYYIAKNAFFSFLLRLSTICLGIILFLYLWGYTKFQLHIEHIFDQSHMIDFTYLYSIDTKLMYLNSFYTPQILLFAALGFIVLSLFVERRAVVLCFLASVIFFISLQQISIIERIITLERPLLSFGAAALLMLPSLILLRKQSLNLNFNGVQTPLKINVISKLFRGKSYYHEGIRHHITKISSKSQKSDLGHRRASAGTRVNLITSDFLGTINTSSYTTRSNILYGIIVALLLIPVLIMPYKAYIGQYSQHGDAFANFNTEEVDAAKWIEKNTPRNYLVFSDPITVLEMRGLAFRENIPEIGWNITVAKLVQSALTSDNAAEAYSKIVSNFGRHIIIIITPRTSQWLKINDFNTNNVNVTNYFVSFPIDKFHTFVGFNKFFNTEYFNLEYKSSNLFVYTLKPSQLASRYN